MLNTRLLSDFLGALNAHDLELADSPVTATQLSGLLQMMADEKISSKCHACSYYAQRD